MEIPGIGPDIVGEFAGIGKLAEESFFRRISKNIPVKNVKQCLTIARIFDHKNIYKIFCYHVLTILYSNSWMNFQKMSSGN